MFRIEPRSAIPVYEQLKRQIRLAVASGRLAPGERLPSIRELAVSLRINPNTAAKALRQLEAEGLLTIRTGSGVSVAEDPDRLREDRGDVVGLLVETFLADMAKMGMSPEEISEMIRERISRGAGMIQLHDVTCGYGSGSVIEGLSLAIADGETVMVTGPNGAGKSTLLRLLAGVVLPSSGLLDRGLAAGVDPRSRTAYLPDSLSIYRSMTPLRAARFHAGIFHTEPADLELARRAGTDLRRPIADLSLGQRVLVHLEIVLSTGPDLILIDEVLHAVDPHVRNLVFEKLITVMEERNPTLVMVNLNVSEVEFLVDRVIFLGRAGVLLDRSAADLRASVRRLRSDHLPEGLPVLLSRDAGGVPEHIIYPCPATSPSTDLEEMDLASIVTAFMEWTYRA